MFVVASVLNLVIVKKGENNLPGLTDTEKPRMRGPKRESKIHKMFNLGREDDVNTYYCTFTSNKRKKVSKAPKIQRLLTPLTLQRKRAKLQRRRESQRLTLMQLSTKNFLHLDLRSIVITIVKFWPRRGLASLLLLLKSLMKPYNVFYGSYKRRKICRT